LFKKGFLRKKGGEIKKGSDKKEKSKGKDPMVKCPPDLLLIGRWGEENLWEKRTNKT